MPRLIPILVAAALGTLSAASASADPQSDRYAHAAIAQGDYATAERRLIAEARIFPNKPEVMLNLAVVYARTGRTDAARTLYQRVLDQRDVMLLLDADRTASAHMVARAGLTRISRVEYSAL